MSRIDLRSSERYVGVAGILFVLLYIVPAVLWGGVRPDEPAAKVASELVNSRGAAVASAYALLVASVALLVFSAGMTRFNSTSPRSTPILAAFAFGAGSLATPFRGVVRFGCSACSQHWSGSPRQASGY
jgi:hypothetical protein